MILSEDVHSAKTNRLFPTRLIEILIPCIGEVINLRQAKFGQRVGVRFQLRIREKLLQ